MPSEVFTTLLAAAASVAEAGAHRARTNINTRK
jgi:hypothetical protein